MSRSGVWWLVGYGVLFASWLPLRWLDNSTILAPDHSDVIEIGFLTGGLVAVVGALFIWRSVPSWPMKNRIGFTLVVKVRRLVPMAAKAASDPAYAVHLLI
jgi:hypothetical protein